MRELSAPRSMTQRTREAGEIDSPQQLEEANAMFRILRKVLVNHGQSRLKDRIENGWYLRYQQVLEL